MSDEIKQAFELQISEKEKKLEAFKNQYEDGKVEMKNLRKEIFRLKRARDLYFGIKPQKKSKKQLSEF